MKERVLYSGNLGEETRIIITVSGEWIFTGTKAASDNFRFSSKERIVRNMAVPGWIKKAIAAGKAVRVDAVEKTAEGFYVVRGEVLETTEKRVEKTSTQEALGAYLEGNSVNPICLCIKNWAEVDKLKLVIRRYDYVDWETVLFAGDEEIGSLDSGYEYGKPVEEEVTDRFLPRIKEEMATLPENYFSMRDEERFFSQRENGLRTQKIEIRPYVRFEILLSGKVYMRKLDTATINGDGPTIPLKERIVGEITEIKTTESYISGGDGYRRGLKLERPVTYRVAEVTYVYENGMSFVEKERLED